MSSKRLLTIFGATGNQGGSIIDTVLGHSTLSAKYSLRAVTRDPSSSKSQALASKGIELVRANLDDADSLKAAVQGSHGVFGVTDFWSLLAPGVDAGAKEIQQGINLFHASQAAGVKHFIFSSLPNVTKLSGGKITAVGHFDAKAAVQEYAEAHKKGGEMITSYYMPAMFLDELKRMVNPGPDGTPMLALPFPDENRAWPLVAPRRDGGKYVMGLFEAGEQADGVAVQGVSTWTTPRQVVEQLSEYAGKEVKYQPLPLEVFSGFMPEAVREDLTAMFQWIGEHSYYGLGSEKQQGESDKFLVEGAGKRLSFPEYVKESAPWNL